MEVEEQGDCHTGELRDEDISDKLPDDLNRASGLVDYVLPDNSRRRISGFICLILGIAALATGLFADQSASVNGGVVVAGCALIILGFYHFQAGWRVSVDDSEPLLIASRVVGFPVGHASAQLAWRGLRSRPTWRILLYSNESPPEKRALVLVDAVDEEVVDYFVEENPERVMGSEI